MNPPTKRIRKCSPAGCCFAPGVLALAFPGAVTAQGQGNGASPAERLDFSSSEARAASVARLATASRTAKESAENIARARGWPIRGEVGGRTFELRRLDEHGRPIYNITNNVNAAISTGANLIRNTAPYHLNGAGFRAGVWDGGSIRTTHQEFPGRAFSIDGAWQNTHATLVGGTIGAAGIDTNALGMAPSVRLDSYDWDNDDAEMAAAAATSANHAGKLLLSNHSYGVVSGWDFGSWSGSSGDHYHGIYPEREDSKFGMYSSGASVWDNICYNAPYYLPFVAAGNDRIDRAPAVGATFYYLSGGIWLSKAYDPAVDPLRDAWDNGGFDTIGSGSSAKNIMTVGAANDAVSGGVRSVANGIMTTFSSWGPADDGRIKPDLVANGTGLFTPIAGSDAAYGSFSGTSVSTPNATGSAILLQELYADLFPGDAMRASTLKALLIHTADDAGNPGPDYSYGWGYMNVKAAADHIRSAAPDSIVVGTLHPGNPTDTYTFDWNGSSPVRATICWTDPPGPVKTALDDRSRVLVNDLDLRISKGTTFQPFVLNVNSPAANATTGDNITDNVEQILIASPSSGTYILSISHKGTLTGGGQLYSLILSGQALSGLPAVTVTATDATAGEPGSGLGNGTFRFSRTGSTAAALTANFTVSGSAGSGSDYGAIGNAVTFAAGSATAIRTVSVIDDALVEGGETAAVTLTSGSGYSLSSPNSAVVTITDDDSGCTVAAFVTGQVPGSTNNSSNAWVGMGILTGSTPLTVSELGRWCVSGNSGTHTLKLVHAKTGVDVPNGSVVVSMSGASPGQFRYGALATVVTLAGNTHYYLVSQEFNGGDQWHWSNTTVTTTPAARCQSGIYQLNGTWGTEGGANNTFGPVNFKYCAAPALPTVSITASDANAAESGDPGAFIVSRTGSPAAPLTINFAVTGTAASGTDYTTLGTSVTIPAGAGSAPVNLAVIDDAAVETSETVIVTLSAHAAYTVGSPNSAAVTILDDDSGCTRSPFVTGQIPGTLNNGYNAWVGMRILIGSGPLTVSELGRWCVNGNNGTHTLKLVNATTLVDVPNGSVAVSMSGAPPGQYRYGTLATSVTLAANTSYYLVSQEVSGGDQWHWSNTTVTTTSAAQCQAAAHQLNGSWGAQGGAHNTFGPVNFKYCPSPGPQNLAAPARATGTYADWLAAYPGITANFPTPDADPDRDELCNLIEYALGTDPVQFSAHPDVLVSGGKLSVTFPRNVAATDVTLTVQVSDDRTGPWTDLARGVNGGAVVGLLDGVTVLESGKAPNLMATVSDHIPVSSLPQRRFMRLMVTR